jgi:predicted transposase YdaD
MAGPWDSVMKRMIGANPEDFVRWLASEATFVAALDIELKSQHIYADALLKVIKEEKPGLLHVEIQTYYDPEIQVRLMEYNFLASRQYDHLPVYSYVICLREEANVPDSPLIRRFLSEEEIHRFYYRVIRLWLIPAEVILQPRQIGLLPLVTLTWGGKQPEVVNEMVDRLAAAGEWDLLAMSNILGGLTFKKGPEREWFRKKFSMFQDILRESWVYQEIGQEFREEGLEKGREEGRLQEQQEMLRDFLHLRFPETLALANQQTSNIKDPEALRTILTKLFAAQTIEEAKQILLDVNKQ